MHDLRMAGPALVCWAASAVLVVAGSRNALSVAIVAVLVGGMAAGGIAAGRRRTALAVAAITLAAVAASCA